MQPSASHVEDVSRYYDSNTVAFTRFGQGTGTNTVRRAVWGPDVSSEGEAFEFVDRMILAEAERAVTQPAWVMDLGCGVGGSLCFLAQRAAVAGVGVTISGVQAAAARACAERLHLGQRVQFRHADFMQPLPDLPPAQLIFSIEAFVHAPSPDGYFEAAAKLIAPGGTLIICDDYLTVRANSRLTRNEARWLRDFREGWLAPSLVTHEQADAAAQRAGFVAGATHDLTGYLQLGRPRDRVLRALVPVLTYMPVSRYRLRSWRGGDALQRCLKSGLVAYQFSTWRMPP